MSISVNQGDTIILKASHTCQGVVWDAWYFNGNYLSQGIDSMGGLFLKLSPQQGIYRAQMLTCSNCTAWPFVDFSISYTLTGQMEINCLTNIKIFPVPLKNILTISLTSKEWADYTLTFTDIVGHIIREYSLKNVLGEFKQEDDLSSLADGVYFLTIHNEAWIETRKILKVRN